MELLHNDGPEHWCGMCRLGHPVPPAGHGEWLDNLVARCVVKRIVTREGAEWLLGGGK